MWEYINGSYHVIIEDDGTKTRRLLGKDSSFVEYPESIDVKITDYCDLGCAFCHESSTVEGKHADLDKLFDVLSQMELYGQEHAYGGGNCLSHPDIIPFLTKMKAAGVISNITINQGHVGRYFDMIKYLIDEQLVYGVGVSITSNQFKYIDELMSITPNVVLHVIAGVHHPSIVDELLAKYGTVKVLLLGYKDWGFGIQYRDEKVNTLIDKWYTRIGSIIRKKGLTISFDNLAIEQMDLKRWFIGEGWKKFYMGDDFTFTMYVDGVKQQYAPTSRSPERVGFDEMSIVDYFRTHKKDAI